MARTTVVTTVTMSEPCCCPGSGSYGSGLPHPDCQGCPKVPSMWLLEAYGIVNNGASVCAQCAALNGTFILHYTGTTTGCEGDVILRATWRSDETNDWSGDDCFGNQPMSVGPCGPTWAPSWNLFCNARATVPWILMAGDPGGGEIRAEYCGTIDPAEPCPSGPSRLEIGPTIPADGTPFPPPDNACCGTYAMIGGPGVPFPTASGNCQVQPDDPFNWGLTLTALDCILTPPPAMAMMTTPAAMPLAWKLHLGKQTILLPMAKRNFYVAWGWTLCYLPHIVGISGWALIGARKKWKPVAPEDWQPLGINELTDGKDVIRLEAA